MPRASASAMPSRVARQNAARVVRGRAASIHCSEAGVDYAGHFTSWLGRIRRNVRTAGSGRMVLAGPGRAGCYNAATLSSFSLVESGSSALFQSVFPAACRADLTCAGEAPGLLALYSAAAPATCGEAIDVPLMVL